MSRDEPEPREGVPLLDDEVMPGSDLFAPRTPGFLTDTSKPGVRGAVCCASCGHVRRGVAHCSHP